MRPPFEGRRREWESLSGEDLAWLWKQPLRISFGSWHVVHAGMEPCASAEEQDPDQLMHIRWSDQGGRHMSPDPTRPDRRPDGGLFWSEVWRGPGSIVYGHSAWDAVRRDEPAPGVLCLGIDTGCVYGGSLSAAVFEDGREEPHIVHVKAAREYFSYTRRAE